MKIEVSTTNTVFRRSTALAAFSGLLLLGARIPVSHAQNINPGIIDPTNTYAGKTYSQWAAAWWQHYMSLSTTNNPFVSIPSLRPPTGPLAVGQSGPVWYLGGNYASGGTHNYTNTIPGGLGLFALITDIEEDNAGCPTNNYTEAQLRSFARSYQNQAANMSCSIDDVAVSGLTNGLTTPYRVQSTAFSYTCPAVHNVLYDLFGLSCYQNFAGTPYTIPLAVEDGVFVLIAPLSVGPHVIHVTGAYPTLNPPFYEDWTHYLTVLPVTLSVGTIAQTGNLDLIWPQTPDSYTLETTSDLRSPNWQPAGLSVTLSNGIYQASAPIALGDVFFRLKLQ